MHSQLSVQITTPQKDEIIFSTVFNYSVITKSSTVQTDVALFFNQS
jgi:hypothetical protein